MSDDTDALADLLRRVCRSENVRQFPRHAHLFEKRKTGIHARTFLPSPTYDHLFEVRLISGEPCCVMIPGCHDYDKNYFEVVEVSEDDLK